MLSGKPAFRKQDATCTEQEATAVQQEFLSVNLGMGLEHHFPHLYSQGGAGGGGGGPEGGLGAMV